MNVALFLDTETQSLPLFDQPSEHPDQPHVVQLGAMLIDLDTRKELATLDLIIRPDGWTIPDQVAAVHGITTEMARDLGVSEVVAVDALLSMWRPAPGNERLWIAHNSPFDQRIIRIAIKRFFDQREPGAATPLSDVWKAARCECTQRLATPILKLPPTAKMRAAKRFHHKSANLGEAYQHFTGKPLEGAHNALVDVRACAAVYFAIKAGQTEAEAVAA